MNKHIALIPIAGLALLTVVGCATSPSAAGANNNPRTNSTTNASSANTASNSNTNTSSANAVPTSVTSTSDAKTISTSTDNTSAHSGSTSTAYENESSVIKEKGYDVTGTKPNASVQTSSGASLSAWIGVAKHSDGHNQYVFFFLNGKYLGTDTATPSVEVTNATVAGDGIAVTYPVYKANDSFADPTGTPVTITYTWNGSKLVPNKPYPKQFQESGSTSQNPISTKSYATSAEAANQISNIQGSSPSGVPVNLGYGITAKESAGMGRARYAWNEGNWTIEIRYYTKNTGVKQVAEAMVAYLHTHMLPAPNQHGVIVVNSMNANTTSFSPQTIIAWQEGTKVNELQQTGDPVQALQTVVSHK